MLSEVNREAVLFEMMFSSKNVSGYTGMLIEKSCYVIIFKTIDRTHFKLFQLMLPVCPDALARPSSILEKVVPHTPPKRFILASITKTRFHAKHIQC